MTARGPDRPPSPADVAWTAAIATVKAAVIALAVDAFANSTSKRFQGKAMKVRAVGYTAGLLVVPAAWRAFARDSRYPRELDMLVALPLLADAGGNAIGMYDRAHVDDAIHFANGALLAGTIGALVEPRMETAWEAAAFATAIGVTAATSWEVFEWLAMKLGARGMNLSYDDTIEDLIETSLGAMLGGLVTLLRNPARLRRLPGRAGDPILRHA